jgi:hypothetical protein
MVMEYSHGQTGVNTRATMKETRSKVKAPSSGLIGGSILVIGMKENKVVLVLSYCPMVKKYKVNGEMESASRCQVRMDFKLISDGITLIP